MILVGLTGGIGAGKTTVSAMLAQRGAVIIDGDIIVRELQQPGTGVLAEIVQRFGDEILTDQGELNRPALAAIVFPDEKALADLNKIVHPKLREEIARRIADEADTDQVVILDLPLLSENPRQDLSGVVVVDVDPWIARERLINFRGMSAADVDARMSRQADRKTRNAIAGLIIDNSLDQQHLANEVERAWKWILDLPKFQGGNSQEAKS
ncbi:MAG: dephospho-CoA kinase [Ilumatobacteraceae bacterium]